MKNTAINRVKNFKNQRGLASIIIVSVLVLLLTLIAISFSRLMNRSLNRTVNGQLSIEANYAAESALNDVTSYLRAQTDPAAVKASKCNDLLGNNTFISFVKTTSLSGADNITKYTCLLVQPKASDLVYRNLPSYKSQIIDMTSAGSVDKIMFSWQSSGDKKTFPGFGTTLFDETTWNNKNYAPMLRVTIYPMPPVGTLLTNAVEINSKTFFLYPNNDPSNTASNNSFSGTADASIVPVNCSTTSPKKVTGFPGSATSDCNIFFNGLTTSGADHYYLRITPLYGSADLRVQAESSGQLVQFSTQSIIDVTAKANDAVKRLQARVELNGGNSINPNSNSVPEDSLRSANTLCKRLVVSSTQASIHPGSDSNFCSL